MCMSVDYKKTQKELYQPKTTPSVVDVPEMTFIAVDGRGDPNTGTEYKDALEVLYGLSYSIKMSKMSGTQPAGYFEYTVPPLEGLWWGENGYFDGTSILDKNKLLWTSLIRQPDFVTPGVFDMAKNILKKKRPELDAGLARLEIFTEGLCAQIMHLGPYDNEPATVEKMERYITEAGYRNDISEKRRHHEIYLSNPQKTAPDKLKTIIRHPIVKR